MAENSKIEWTHHTFNPWWGCTKVAAGCAYCYADSLSKRTGRAEWGERGTRIVTSLANWREPLKWNRAAEASGERHRVFCASMADVFEDWHGRMLSSRLVHEEACHENGYKPQRFNPVLWHRSDIGVCEPGQCTVGLVRNERHATMDDMRAKLFALIDATPHLDWLLLTKRPENIRRMWCSHVNTDGLPPSKLHRSNVWLGTSIATQEDADRNVPFLLGCRELAPVLFLSAEPLLGPIYLGDSLYEIGYESGGVQGWVQQHEHGIDWVIVGGESGHGARPMHPDWARSLRDQCQRARVPFFFKQWGEYGTSAYLTTTGEPVFRQFSTFEQWVSKASSWVNGGICLDIDGNQLRIGAEFAKARDSGKFPVTVMHRLGKKAAGRLLDGKEWNQFPEVSSAAR